MKLHISDHNRDINVLYKGMFLIRLVANLCNNNLHNFVLHIMPRSASESGLSTDNIKSILLSDDL